MYIDLKKTLEEISRCLPEKGAPTPKQLQRMYELTQRLQSQELAVIYDMEAFGNPAAQEQRTLAQQHSGGDRGGESERREIWQTAIALAG